MIRRAASLADALCYWYPWMLGDPRVNTNTLMGPNISSRSHWTDMEDLQSPRKTWVKGLEWKSQKLLRMIFSGPPRTLNHNTAWGNIWTPWSHGFSPGSSTVGGKKQTRKPMKKQCGGEVEEVWRTSRPERHKQTMDGGDHLEKRDFVFLRDFILVRFNFFWGIFLLFRNFGFF